jgi:drug/metabolite transporter (DMT)-like permease
MSVGIILAVIAMLSWGIGDFLIQRSTRSIGNFETLFIITGFGSLILLPFVWSDLHVLFANPINILLPLTISGVVIFVAALLEFESLREGKLSVIEPIWSLEIPTAVLIAYIVLDEVLSGKQIALIALLILALAFTSFKGGKIKARHFLEKGALLAVLAALTMGTANFFMGYSGRISDSLLTNFVASVIIAVITLIYIIAKGRIKKMIQDIKSQPKTLLAMSFFDNLAWVAFVAAMAISPIGIVVALTESYIIIVVLLGIFVNKERLVLHQKIGLIVAVLTAITLASISG